MEKRAVGWMVTEGARLKVVSNIGGKKGKIEEGVLYGTRGEIQRHGG